MVLGAIVVYSAAPNPGHDGNGITVTINGVEKTLTQTVNDLQSLSLTYVGSCLASHAGGECKCNSGEKIMLLQTFTGDRFIACTTIDQNKDSVKGRSEYQWTGCTFACFK